MDTSIARSYGWKPKYKILINHLQLRLKILKRALMKNKILICGAGDLLELILFQECCQIKIWRLYAQT